MRLPTFIFGLAALLAVPALLLAQDAGQTAASKAAEAGKDTSAASTGAAGTRTPRRQRNRPRP